MNTVTLYLNNGSKWSYDLVSEETGYIKMEDQDGTLIKLNKVENKLYKYDMYSREWLLLENTSKALEQVKINREVS